MKGLFILVLVAACEAPAPVEPIVSVLKRTPTCFALMTPDQPPADALALDDTCTDAAPPVVFAGTDVVEVVVDYGSEVDFAATADVPPPVLAITVDGEPADVPVTIEPHRVRARAFFVATFRAPAKPSSNVRVAATVADGFATTSPTVFSTVPAPVSVGVAECDPGTGTCALVGAVGQVHATVGIPGDVGVPVAIHQTIDGQPLPDATATLVPANDRAAATLAIDVPAGDPAAAVATWILDAQVGDGHAAPIAIALSRPQLAAQLSCGAHCIVPKGAVVGLEIDAPPAIHPQRAFVTTRLAGVPQLVDLPIDLNAGVGLASLTAPTTGVGSWTIDVRVAGYAAPTIEALVQ